LAFGRSHRLRYASASGLGLGLALLAKVANVVAWPPFLVYGFWVASRQGTAGARRDQTVVGRVGALLPFAAAFLLPLAAACLALAVYNFARSGNPLDLGYAADETFSTPLWRGLAGLLFSPGKGLFLYAPILLAALLGIPALFRRERAIALLVLSVAAIYPLLYGRWFMWWAGWSWGPRFVLPSLPFLCLFLAPVVHWVLQPGRWWAKATLALLSLLSVAVQILAVTVDFNQYLLLLYQRGLDSGEINFQVGLSPSPGSIGLCSATTWL